MLVMGCFKNVACFMCKGKCHTYDVMDMEIASVMGTVETFNLEKIRPQASW